ncbi:preprotein translocase subunit YajC [Nocardiopsis suaedae]|uniref:Preprotein translocase subunit YajC n=1 Tax=Nocardiopsis suaedae TaxID=3018444 RepID=A0ABT4TU97_9ACTN|nr:preprotein translocase subunit YajC [Nocardiopsis suaedae]MDA2808278.1 preprotein translocase subunit YajC [Nocardiopsis suaedae]
MQGTTNLAQPVEAAVGGGTLQSILMIGLLVLVFYLLIIRPQQRRRKQQTDMQSRLRPGQEVLTQAGFYGTVVEVRDSEVELEISPGSRIRILKAGIADVVPEPGAADDDTPVEDRPDFPGKDSGSDGDDKNDGSK